MLQRFTNRIETFYEYTTCVVCKRFDISRKHVFHKDKKSI